MSVNWENKRKLLKNYTLFALTSLNYGNLIVIYHTLAEICTSNHLFSFFCNCKCNCNKFKLWIPYANVLTQYSRTKLTLLLFFLIPSVERGWRCIRVCHWGHGKVSVVRINECPKWVNFKDEIRALRRHKRSYHSMHFFLPFHWSKAQHVTCK